MFDLLVGITGNFKFNSPSLSEHMYECMKMQVDANLHKRDGKFPMVALARSDKKWTVSATEILQNYSRFFSRQATVEPSVKRQKGRQTDNHSGVRDEATAGH